MSETTAKIKLIFDGVERGVVAAAAKSEAAIKGLSRETGTASKWVGLFAVATGAGAAAVGAALPALASLGLQFGVVKLAMKANNAESKAFKAQLAAMKKPIQDLENAAGKAFLPGVTKFLKDSTGLFPLLDHAIARTGKIMGDTASKMGDLFKTENFQQSLEDLLRSSDSITSAIGDSLVQLAGKIVEFGGKMAPAAEGFATFIRDAATGLAGFLDGLAPHANDFKSIFESLGSIVQDLLPIIGQLAGALSADLAPILHAVAGFIHDNQAALSSWVPYIAAAALAFGSLKVVLPVVGWIGQLGSALGLLGGKAEGASGKVGGLVGKLGGLKAIGVGVALGAAAVAMDKVNASSEQGNLSGWNGELHDIARILTGDWGNPFADINAQLDQVSQKWSTGQAPVQQWAAAVGKGAADAATSVQGFFRNLLGMAPPPPVPLHVDTTQATAGVNAWRALANGAAAIGRFLANNSDAIAKVLSWQGLGNAASAIARLLANSSVANAVVSAWRGLGNATAATARLLANSSVANAVVNAWRGLANGAAATARFFANTSAATGAINAWRNWASSIVVTVRAVLSKIGFAGGGPVVGLPGFAPGGPVHGPGSGTSDSVPAMLSAGEWVMTADQVRRAGGFAGMAGIASALSGHGRASARAALRTPSAPRGSSGGGGTVVQFAGNTSDALATVIMGMIRTGKIQIKAA